MGYTVEILDDVREQIAPEDVTLKTARGRRADAIDAAKQVDGVARAVASRLGVGVSALIWHAHNMGLIDEAVLEELQAGFGPTQ